ncbi:hypothetical protein GCM10018962_48950 [Dactylosporangium matsuzakiense]
MERLAEHRHIGRIDPTWWAHLNATVPGGLVAEPALAGWTLNGVGEIGVFPARRCRQGSTRAYGGAAGLRAEPRPVDRSRARRAAGGDG